jgi:hypothetical protein
MLFKNSLAVFRQLVFSEALMYDIRSGVHRRGLRTGEGFFRQTRQFSAGMVCPFQGKLTQYGGKTAAGT